MIPIPFFILLIFLESVWWGVWLESKAGSTLIMEPNVGLISWPQDRDLSRN